MGKITPPVKAPAAWLQAFFPLIASLLSSELIRVLSLESFAAATLGHDNGLRCFAASMVLLLYVNHYLGSKVVGARYKHNVPLPFMYPADAVNAKQEVKDPVGYMQVVRGHENFLEFLPMHLACSLLLALSPEDSTLHRPFTAAVGNLAAGFGRMMYAVAYESDPQYRLAGLILSLMLGSGMIVGQVILFAIFGT